MKKKIMLWAFGALILAFTWFMTGGGTVLGYYETPEYTVEKADGPIEIRQYPALLVAEVTTKGGRDPAVNSGFRALADFIFGNNAPRAKVAMTTPVVQESSSKIAMTTPVIQSGAAGGQEWVTRFVMPKQYTVETLPKPNNGEVRVVEVPARRVIALRFSGFITDKNINRHEEKLMAYINTNKIRTKSGVSYAYYDPPWTLPFFRRNEVILELQ